MKVFVTGNLGYVGTVLHKRLLQSKHDVTGYDIGYFPKSWDDEKNSFPNLSLNLPEVNPKSNDDETSICKS